MTILVTGATGNVGRHLVERLAAAGHPVRALTRDPAKARFPEGVEAVAGDFTDLAGMERALDGATALHLMTTFGPRNETVPHSAQLASAALAAGVKRVSLLWNGYRGPVEEAFAALNPVELQPGEFMSNALTWAEEIREHGAVSEPFAHIGHAPIHEADIAAVAALALTTDDLAGRRIPLTGPGVVTVPDQVASIAIASGRDIRFTALDEDQGRLRMQALGYDEGAIDYVMGWRADPPEWTLRASDTVERLTGTPARTFDDWAREHADAFR